MSKNRVVSQKKAGVNGGVMSIEAVVLGEGSNALFSVLSPDAGADYVPEQKTEDLDTSAEYQPWGTDNQYPQNARKKLEASTTALPLIAKKTALMYGKGLVYWKPFLDEDKTTWLRDYSRVPEIETFLAENDANYFMLERLQDHNSLNNLFCEFILDKALKKITNFSHLEAEFSRFGPANDKNEIQTIVYDGNWADPKTKSEIPYVNRRYASPDNIRKIAKSKKKFAMHICFPSPGRPLYAIAPHAALFKDKGWLDYASSVPVIMNTINENGLNIKYHIQIPYEYWRSINSNFDGLDDKAQKAFIDDKLTVMQDWLKGDKNSGKSFITHFATDEVTGKPLAGWIITVLDNKTSPDAMLTSTQEADTQTARALDMDSSLAGLQPAGGKMGAGSGSDKRVAHTNAVSMSHAHQWIITHPLRIVQAFNGWPPEICWGFEHDVPVPLNESPSGTETKQ